MKQTPDPKRQFRISLAVLVGLMVVGVAGFHFVGEDRSLFDSLWLTVNYLTTVGDTHRPDMTKAEEAWAGVLMLAGVLTVLYVGVNFVAFIVEGELRQILGRRKLDNKSKLLRTTLLCAATDE